MREFMISYGVWIIWGVGCIGLAIQRVGQLRRYKREDEELAELRRLAAERWGHEN